MGRKSDKEFLGGTSPGMMKFIISGFKDPVFVLDDEGQIRLSNQGAVDLFEKLELKKQFPVKIASRIKESIRKEIDYVPSEIGDSILLKIEETERWYLPRIISLKNEGKTINGWIVTLIDVTMLRLPDDLKNDLIATLSHEINTPLTSIRMILHLLSEQKTGPLNQTQEKMVQSATDECERLMVKLSPLVKLYRDEKSQSCLQFEKIKPSVLVEDAVSTFSGSENPTKIKIKIGDSLPDVLVDRFRISQVLINILSNALKYGPANEEVLVKAEKYSNNLIRFSIIDQGPGVPTEEKTKIFDRFYRSKTRKAKGSGLGLWIAGEIVRAHNGLIGIHCGTGISTEVYFDLPVAI